MVEPLELLHCLCSLEQPEVGEEALRKVEVEYCEEWLE